MKMLREGEPTAGPYKNRERQDLLPKSFLGQDRMPDGRTISSGDDVICLGKQFEAEALPARPIEVLNNQLNYNIAYPPNIAGWPEPTAIGNEWMSAGALVGAFPIDEESDDAAMIIALEPGLYTIKISGEDGTTGLSLVELYAIP
jgi:hypothetical protein